MGRFYVTTPIYYVNDAPHIGHAYTTVAADALARWRRLVGDDVLFLTGTDEHGLKNKQAADAIGVEPQVLADRNSARFREAWATLDIAYDDFIRTTENRHVQGVRAFLQAVYDNGDIERDSYEGLYCVACEAYYVEDDLVEGNCPIHGRPVERMREENYFFKLSRYQDRLLEHYAAHPEAVQPEARRNEVLGFIRQGLQDFSVSRTSISWGIPIPWDPAHVAYVWFDALINYCTAMGYGSDRERFEHLWPVDYHLVGKDILRFHAVYWPAMLMAAGEAPPKCVFAHGWLLVGGEKMSKTRLNQIHPADLVATFGSDGFRYHFMRDQSFGPDGDFSYEAMVARYNADLANNFGNLANRVLTMAASYLGGVSPDTREDGPLRRQAET
ncbi:MAG: class I tRNA ligase family protein, partial [Acidimicrobiales bacterium]